MKISKRFLDYQLLKSPSLDIDLYLPHPLKKYSTEDAIKISTIFVSSYPNAPKIDLPKEVLDWVLMCYAYSLRVEDYDKRYYLKAFNYYKSAILMLLVPGSNGFQENKKKYLDICLCHLSQIFLNEAFLKEYNHVVTPTFLKSFQKLSPISSDFILSITKFLICGCYDLLTTDLQCEGKDEVIKCFQENILKIFTENNFDSNHEFFSQIDSNIDKLLNFSSFRDDWIQSFNGLYESKINDKEFPGCKKLVLNYFIEKINGFSKSEKDKAFTNVISLWKQSNKGETRAFTKWKTEEIKRDYLSWISTDIPNEGKYHPLFELIKYGEEETDGKLQEIAKEHISLQLSIGYGEETDLFWYLPVYAYDFLMSNHETLSKFGIISFSKRYSKIAKPKDIEINLHLLYLANYVCSIKKDDINYISKITKIFNRLLNDFPNNLVLLVPTLFFFSFCQRNDLFWFHFNRFINFEPDETLFVNNFNFDEEKSKKFSNELTSILLLSSLLTDFRDKEFNNGINIVSNKENFWNIINSLKLTFNDKLRLLLSLYIFSFKTNRFINLELPKFLKEINTNEKNESLNQLIQMCKLSVVTGGKIFKFNPNYSITENTKMYITKKDFIISIHNDNQIIIRHALGLTLFNIKDITNYSNNISNINLEFNNSTKFNPFGEDCFKGKIDNLYENSLDEMEKMFEADNINNDFIEYIEPEQKIPVSVAHSLLINTGFISLNSESYIGYPISPNKKNNIDALDRLESKSILDIFIFQLVEKSNKKCEIAFKESNEFKNFIDKINVNIHSDIFNYKFQSILFERPLRDYKIDQQNLGFIILFNETGRLANLYSGDFDCYGVTITITPFQKDIYLLEILLNANSVLSCGQLRFYLHISQVGQVLAMLSVLFITKSPKEANYDKIKKLTAKFSQRKAMIHGIYEGTTKEKREIALELFHQFEI